MIHRVTLLAAICCLFLAGACKKSKSGNNPANNPLTGSWTFDGETSNGNATSTVMVGPLSVKVVSVIAFRTINNAGTVTFNSDSMVLMGLAYGIDTSFTTYTYTGLTVDSTQVPFASTVPPSDTLVTYQLIGQDSIYFPNGSPFAVNVDSLQPPIQIKGAHFSISGTNLTLTSTINQTSNATVNGITAPATVSLKGIVNLTKQ
ncbi:MAG TPA: hypothetical protein VGR89_00025 [Puia sp.]|nr:hypothetical protein [Puia sp.]